MVMELMEDQVVEQVLIIIKLVLHQETLPLLVLLKVITEVQHLALVTKQPVEAVEHLL